MYMSGILLHFLAKYMYLIGVWLGEDQRTKSMKTHFKKKLDDVIRLINYFMLNSEHNWEDLCTQPRNQQTCIFENYNQIMENLIFSYPPL